jgi:hypothetical protein
MGGGAFSARSVVRSVKSISPDASMEESCRLREPARGHREKSLVDQSHWTTAKQKV